MALLKKLCNEAAARSLFKRTITAGFKRLTRCF